MGVRRVPPHLPLNLEMGSVPKSRKLSHRLFLQFLSALAIWFNTPISSYAGPETAKPYLRQIRIDSLSKAILALDIANGSNLAAAALSDLRVRVWRLDSGQLVHEFSFTEPATDQHLKLADEVEPISLHFSPNGKILAVGFLNSIHLYSVPSWEEQNSLTVPGEDQVRPGTTTTHERPELQRRPAEQAQAQSQQPIRDINQTMREWAAKRGQGDGRTRILTFEFTSDGSSILASYCRSACYFSTWAGSRWMFPSGKDPLRLWNVSLRSLTWERMYDPKGVMSRIVLLPNDERFVGVNSELGHCAVGAYDLATGQTLWSNPLRSCASPPILVILPDSHSFITNRIAEANHKNKAYRYAALYETASGKKIADIPDADGVALADISSDGRWLVSTTWRGTQFQIWDLQAKKIVMKAVPKGWSRTADCVLNRVRLSQDNRWLVVGCNMRGDLAVYQWAEGQYPPQPEMLNYPPR